MPDPLGWIDEALAERAARGLFRRLDAVEPAGPGGREPVAFASNDYLGLAGDPRLRAAALAAAESAATWGAGASPLVSGWRGPHRELAEALARFEGAEAVALFPSGFAANLGTVAALVGPGDAVYLDRLNHACLVDGARLSGASLRVYSHADADRLGRALARDRGRFRRVLIATDGVFSMDGDLAPLAEIADLADRFEAMLLVDEAHGTGVFGPDGRGAASECGVAGRVPVKVGTLSKALGSIGGFVAGSRRLVDWLVNQARPLIYSTALPPAAAGAALEALRIVEAEPWRRDRARQLGLRVGRALAAAGHAVEPRNSPIVPVVVGEPGRAVELADRLRGRGLIVPAIRPPTVPAGTARLRISLNAGHLDAEVDALIEALGPARSPAGPFG